MKITGIIAEYNPFHNGHKYHLEQARAVTGADFCIAVIGGDFLQRGVPAAADKYMRAETALLNGADLVLELPLFYAAGSAEFFAMGAVTLLDKLGAVDALCFGSESGSLSVLSKIADILANEPEHYRNTLQTALKKGASFPQARSIALADYFPDSSEYQDAVTSPNNILGIEYLKALSKRNSRILPFTIKREGNQYHDIHLNSPEYNGMGMPDASVPDRHDVPLSSASAIRSSIAHSGDLSRIRGHVPDSVYRLLQENYLRRFPISSNDFSLLLKYRLLMEADKGYADYLDITADFSDKIRKNLNAFESFEQFCGLLKSKDLTYSRISRGLLHILLGMTAAEMHTYLQHDYIRYARILGFRKSSGELLGVLKKSASVPLISKLADAPSYLTQPGRDMLEKDILSAHIYDSVVSSKYHTPFVPEYAKRLIIIE